MPGAPHMRSGKPMAERSTFGVVWMFMIVPIPVGVAILWAVTANVVANGHQLTAADWFWQVAWFGLLGLGLLTALPAVGWRELRRRRRKQPAASQAQASGQRRDDVHEPPGV